MPRPKRSAAKVGRVRRQLQIAPSGLDISRVHGFGFNLEHKPLRTGHTIQRAGRWEPKPGAPVIATGSSADPLITVRLRIRRSVAERLQQYVWTYYAFHVHNKHRPFSNHRHVLSEALEGMIRVQDSSLRVRLDLHTDLTYSTYVAQCWTVLNRRRAFTSARHAQGLPPASRQNRPANQRLARALASTPEITRGIL